MGLTVVNPGLCTTVQDGGRPGYAAWGVAAGGAFDRGSAELANAFLGNSAGCALLEMTLVGGTYETDRPLAMALAGAPIEARVVEVDHSEQPLRVPSSFSLREGARLLLGQTISGARTYLAVRGGWQTTLILGSRSSEQPLRAGSGCRPKRRACHRGTSPIQGGARGGFSIPDRRGARRAHESQSERGILGRTAVSSRTAARPAGAAARG